MWIPRQTIGPIALLDRDVTLGTPEFSPSMDYILGDRVSLCWKGHGRQLVDAHVVDLSGGSLVVELQEDIYSRDLEKEAARAGDRTRVAESDIWFVTLSR